MWMEWMPGRGERKDMGVKSLYVLMRAHAIFNCITTSIFVFQYYTHFIKNGWVFSRIFFTFALLHVNVNAINLITVSQAAIIILLLLINGFCNRFVFVFGLSTPVFVFHSFLCGRGGIKEPFQYFWSSCFVFLCLFAFVLVKKFHYVYLFVC